MQSKKLKSLLLLVLLVLPASIFIFLKSFGRNEFVVPIYYEQGVGDTLTNDCGRSSEVPYRVFTKPATQVRFKVYHFEKAETANLNFRLEELERVQDVFAEDDAVLLFSFLNSPSITARAFQQFDDRINFDPSFWSIRPVDSLSYNVFKNCELVMNDQDDRVVLVDKEERIRGYFDITDREETDRLILELKILLSQEE